MMFSRKTAKYFAKLQSIDNGYIFKYGRRVTNKKGLYKVLGTLLANT